MAHIQRVNKKRRGKDKGFKASAQRGSYPATDESYGGLNGYFSDFNLPDPYS